jgi:hypothetical protein
MPSVNPGPATTQTISQAAAMTPVNAQASVFPGTAGNGYRLLGVARGVSGNSTGDAALLQINNASSWTPSIMVTSNGQVSGVAGSIATLALGLFTAAAAGGTAIKSNAALASNSAANSSIAVATTIANLAYTNQVLYVNIGSALANSTVDVFLYGYDVS